MDQKWSIIINENQNSAVKASGLGALLLGVRLRGVESLSCVIDESSQLLIWSSLNHGKSIMLGLLWSRLLLKLWKI